MENTAGNARWRHSDRQKIHPGVHPGNRDEVFIWQNFQLAYRDLDWKSEISETGPARSTGLIWRGPNRLEHGLHIGILLGVPLNGQPKWHLKHFFDCLTCTFHVPYITGANLGLVIFYHCSDSCLYILKVSIFLKEWLCEKGHRDCFRVIQRSQASFFNTL